MNKYLLTSAICTSVLFTGYFVFRYVTGLFFANAFATYMVFFGILGCIAACITCLVFGIKGIKDKITRGQSIAAVVVSGVGLTFGTFTLFYYLIYSLLASLTF